MLALLLLQAATAAPPERIDLLAAANAGCTAPDGDAILVCSRRDSERIARSVEAAAVPKNPLAFALPSGASGVVVPGQAYRSDGLVDRRVTVRVTKPF